MRPAGADTFTAPDWHTCEADPYNVPSNVLAVDVVVIGQGGVFGLGSSDQSHGGGVGGRGGRVSAHLQVTPGETLWAGIGCFPGSQNFSGIPGDDGRGGSGSGIFTTSVGDPTNRLYWTTLVIAGGGGGGGGGGPHGPGGTGGDVQSKGNDGSNNESAAGAGGGGATATSGGAGGNGGCSIGAGHAGQIWDTPGGSGFGGDCADGDNDFGGGGGGGYYNGGGGGGGDGDGGGGGGGGSDFVVPAATNVVETVTTDQASVTITPVLFQSSTSLTSSPNPANSIQAETFTATISGSPSPAGQVDFQRTPASGGPAVDMGTATAAGGIATLVLAAPLPAGVWTVTASYGGDAADLASTSAPLTQTVGTPPSILIQPVDSISDLPAGGAGFTTVAAGDSFPTVQWQQSQDGGTTWQDMRGSTSPTLTLICTYCVGRYRAVYTNPLGSVTTDSVLAAVNHPPSAGFVSDVSGPLGGSATFTALASAYPQPAAHWQVSTDHGTTWSDPDATRTTVVNSYTPPRADQYTWQSTLTFNDVAAADEGTEVRAIFSNTIRNTAESATSNAATLHLTPSCIVAHPTGTNFSHCAYANLSGLDLHNVEFSYGDYSHASFFGDTLDGANFQTANLTGAVFGNVSLVNTFFDSVNMTGAYLVGDDFSRAVPFRFSAVTGTILVPSDTTVYTTGSSAMVTWPTPPTLGLPSFDCNPASGSSFPLDTATGGTTVTCTNSNVVQGTFTVHVLPAVAPQVTQQPVDSTVFWQPGGYATTFTATASGTPAPTVQWQVSVDGGKTFTDIAGATFDELLVTNPPFSATGNQYQAVFTNMAGTATSNPATLHVGPQPIGVAVAGSQTFGDLLPTLTPTFSPPNGETLQGTVSCTGVFGQVSGGDTPITASLAPGSYLIDPASCSGLTPTPDSTDYAVQYQPGPFVVSPVTITVNVSGTLTPGAGPPVFTETDDGPAGLLPSAKLITCSTVNGGTGITARPGRYTLDGSSCTYNPPFSNPDYTVQFAGVTGGFVVTPAAVHVAVAGGEQYGGTPSFSDAGDDAALSGVTLSGILTCAAPSGPSPLPVGLYTASGASCSGLTATPSAPIDYQDGPFSVSPAPLALTADDKSMVYGQPLPSFTYQLNGLVGTDPPGVVSGVTCSAPSAGPMPAVGTYHIVCSGGIAANYGITGYTDGTLTVTRAKATVVAEAKSMTYGGKVPLFTDHVDGLVNSDSSAVVTGVSCVSDAGTAPVVGTYTISCSGGSAANYTLSYTPAVLTVGKAPLDVTANNKAMTYGGPVASVDATVLGLVNSDTFAALGGSCSDAAATVTLMVGTYSGAITCSGVDTTNYTVTYHAGTLTVAQRGVTLVADDQSMSYGGTIPTFTFHLDGLVNNDSPAVTGAVCSAGSLGTTPAVGAYLITCGGGTTANYAVTGYKGGTLTVMAKKATVVAEAKTMTYGGTVPAFTWHVDGLVSPDTYSVVTGVSCVSGAATAPVVGTYTITCSGGSAGNYDLSYTPAMLTVGQAPLSVTAKDKTMTYGGPVPKFDATVVGLVNGDTFNALGGACADPAATVTLVAGSYPAAITCSGVSTANYSVTYHSGALTVGREPLTVTAKPKSMGYGGTVPSFDATVSGLVNGDSFGGPGVGGSCGSSTASATLAAGTYPGAITCGGVNPANYDPTYYPGTLTVNQASLTVTADNKTMTYGYPVPALTATLSGFANNQNLVTSGVNGTANCITTPTATSAAPSGPYTITCTVGSLAAANYTFGPFVAGTLTISKHPATVGYTGSMFVSTGSSSATTASVPLQAVVAPGSGGAVDLTKAQVTFLLYKSTNLSMASPDATCVASPVSATGVATCTASGLAVDNWTVIPIIPASNAYFIAPQGDPVILSVYQPTTGLWATGGGWVSDPSSTVSSTNRHGNFGFNVRYTTNNAPKGQSVFAFRGADGYDYVVKSNSWQGGGLSFSTTGTGFNGKASVIVIDPTTGLQVTSLGGGNFSFRVDATQNTSTPSTYAISVYSSTGVLWHQAGTTTKQLPLGGGTIVVHPK